MNTLELMKELSKKSNEEIRYCLLYLMIKRKIEFKDLSESYVSLLENKDDDNKNKLIEAGTNILESLLYDKFNKKQCTQDSIQRRLYFLNKQEQFNMGDINKKFNYDENKGEKLSWYENNKTN